MVCVIRTISTLALRWILLCTANCITFPNTKVGLQTDKFSISSANVSVNSKRNTARLNCLRQPIRTARDRRPFLLVKRMRPHLRESQASRTGLCGGAPTKPLSPAPFSDVGVRLHILRTIFSTKFVKSQKYIECATQKCYNTVLWHNVCLKGGVRFEFSALVLCTAG